MGFLPAKIWTQQPQDGINVALPAGLLHIATYLPNGYNDVNGLTMTRGSAASFATVGAGRALNQTAVNTSIYREIASLPLSKNKYIAVWSGVVVGGPTSTSPKLVGISTTATSQSVDYLGIERGPTGADYLQITSKSNTSNVSREFNVGLTALYGKQLTLVGVYSPVESLVRLHVFANNAITTYSSAVSSAVAPAVLGTERFVVGVDIIENPTRSANVYCNLGSVFAGDCNVAFELAVAVNPWQIFKPLQNRIFASVAGGGATGTLAKTNANDSISAAGTTTVTGSTAKTNENDTVSGDGTTTVSGTSSTTNANDASATAGTTTILGAAGVSNNNDTVSASGTAQNAGGGGSVGGSSGGSGSWSASGKQKQRDRRIKPVDIREEAEQAKPDLKAKGLGRIYFDDSEARRVIKVAQESARDTVSQQADEPTTTNELHEQVDKLAANSAQLQSLNTSVALMRALIEKEQRQQEQQAIEEMDIVFVMTVLAGMA